MTNDKTPTAGIIIIGDEILSGRTLDTNSQTIARTLNALGIRLKRISTIPDDLDIICSEVRKFSATYTYVFTTGGIGPTHDDITAEAIAAAVNRPLIQDPEAYQRLLDYYGPDGLNEARLRMANAPEGAQLIENTVSAAPGFCIENIYVMAGVPQIMQAMLGHIAPKLKGGKKLHALTVSCSIPEGNLADDFQQILDIHPGPGLSIGSYPFGADGGRLGTEVVFRSEDSELVTKAAREIIKRYPELCKLVTDL